MTDPRSSCTAIWALTPNGAALAHQLAGALTPHVVFLPASLSSAETAYADETCCPGPIIWFDRLKDTVSRVFNDFSAHIFIMATGIVVRTIAGLLVHKTKDPAVVVCDEAGRFAISLISGHLGGANRLAKEVAAITQGQAVITTATDVNQVPAIDLIAAENRLIIENPDAIRFVNMALIMGAPIRVYDPYSRVIPHLPPEQIVPVLAEFPHTEHVSVLVDHHIRLDLPATVLVLRPSSLVAGMGCNRNTPVSEMRALLEETMADHRLSLSSLRALATVDLKADEPGFAELARILNLPIMIFSRDQLAAVSAVPNPSTQVEKHIGVKSVCEAAALLATRQGHLIVPKQKTPNVTLAVAADSFISSASAQEARNT